MDAAAIYGDARRRIIGLVTTLSPDQLATTVPGSPLWTVKDVVAHLAGVPVDVQAGRIEGAATAEWTARQVDERLDRSIDDLVAEWDEAAPGFEALLSQVPAMSLTAMDIVTHEADIRDALGLPRGIDDDVLDQLVQRVVGTIGKRLEQAAGPALRIKAGVDEWIVGPGDPAATLTTEPYELLRVGFGRRSEGQIRSYGWDGDPDSYLPYLSVFPFSTEDLSEPA